MNFINIGNNKLVNADLISGLEIIKKNKKNKGSVIIHVGNKSFISDLPLNEVIDQIKPLSSNTQYWGC